jgi:hypothetical protein
MTGSFEACVGPLLEVLVEAAPGRGDDHIGLDPA